MIARADAAARRWHASVGARHVARQRSRTATCTTVAQPASGIAKVPSLLPSGDSQVTGGTIAGSLAAHDRDRWLLRAHARMTSRVAVR